MSKFIENHKQTYKTYQNKPWDCPALQEPVYFTSEGLNHLLYKRQRPRNKTEQHYRCGLIPFIPTVIEKSETALKRIENARLLIFTWNLEYKVSIKGTLCLVKVVLIKKGNSRITFLSAMSKKINTKKVQR